MIRAVFWTLAVVLGAQVAGAHVAPAVNENNRYLKLVPMGDRVRLSYTVFFGQVPGLRARQDMDRDRSGQLSEAETSSFADALATEIAADLQLEIDGNRVSPDWDEVHVGLGDASATAGAFSVDLVTFVCTNDAAEHRLAIVDGYVLARPGEGELSIEIGPDIELVDAGSPGPPKTKLSWLGHDHPFAVEPFVLVYRSGATAFRPDAPCRAGAAAAPVPRRRIWLGLLCLAVATVLAGGLAWRRRSRR